MHHSNAEAGGCPPFSQKSSRQTYMGREGGRRATSVLIKASVVTKRRSRKGGVVKEAGEARSQPSMPTLVRVCERRK